MAPAATMSIGDLRREFVGQRDPIQSEVAVEGIVTSSDEAGNFFRTIVLEDRGAAIELKAGIDHLHNDFPVGSHATLLLQGLVLGSERGVLTAGTKAVEGSRYPNDFLGSPVVVAHHLRHDPRPVEEVVPRRVMIRDLRPEMCGTLIEISDLALIPSSDEQPPYRWSDTHEFVDLKGQCIETYVRRYARFAEEEIPVGRCSIRGVLQYNGKVYTLKMRYKDDCFRP